MGTVNRSPSTQPRRTTAFDETIGSRESGLRSCADPVAAAAVMARQTTRGRRFIGLLPRADALAFPLYA
jgi:hypothetical protein